MTADDHFALEVKGDSMIDAGILEGDTVILKRTDSAESGDIVVALVDEMAAAGGSKPLCVGIESGTATGWMFTDWVEDMMLRTVSPEDYDAWTTNELPFNDPKVIGLYLGTLGA